MFALFLKTISHKGTKDTKKNDPAGYLCGLAALRESNMPLVKQGVTVWLFLRALAAL
ncbi:MAG TPA: hypothetical protein PKI62_06670 [bacterium]|nr:hypothetical protein [bacterium]HPR88674.1 hypothetical protein [bacterium]